MAHHSKNGHERCDCCNEILEEHFVRIEASIARVGFGIAAGTAINATGHKFPYIYTVGLGAQGLPEIVLSGISIHQGGVTLADAAQALMEGSIRTSVRDDRFLHGLDVMMVPIPTDKASGLLDLASRRTNGKVSGLQVVWPDAGNLFPWDKGYNQKFSAIQGLLWSLETTDVRPPVPESPDGDLPLRLESVVVCELVQPTRIPRSKLH